MFDDNISNQKIKYQFEQGPWTGTEASSVVTTNDPVSNRPSLVGSMILGMALSANLSSVPCDWSILPPQQSSQHTYSESRTIAQQATGSPRISRAEAIRLAKANRARIESQLRAEVERDAAVPAIWEEE